MQEMFTTGLWRDTCMLGHYLWSVGWRAGAIILVTLVNIVGCWYVIPFLSRGIKDFLIDEVRPIFFKMFRGIFEHGALLIGPKALKKSVQDRRDARAERRRLAKMTRRTGMRSGDRRSDGAKIRPL